MEFQGAETLRRMADDAVRRGESSALAWWLQMFGVVALIGGSLIYVLITS